MHKRIVFPVLLLLLTTSLAAQEAATPKDYAALADALTSSLVRVEYTLQYDKGEAPRGSGLGYRCPNCGRYHSEGAEEYVREERPLEVAGFLLSPTMVVSPDLVMHPRFIKSITVRFGSQKVKATPVSYAKHQRARFLKLVQPLADAKPLVFDTEKKPPYLVVTYAYGNGAWNISVEPLSAKVCITDSGRRFLSVPSSCLIVDKQGTPAGMSMKEELPVDDSWKGSPLKWETCTAAEMSQMLERLEEVSNQGLLRLELGFRSPKKSEDYSFRSFRDEEQATVRNLAGILVDEETVLVLADLKPKTTARLERIVAYPPEGEPVPAKFSCTLSDYGCFLAKLERALPGQAAFSSESILEMDHQLLLATEVLIQGEKRVLYFGHNRITSFEFGWKRQVYPEVAVADDHLFLFDPDGALIAFPVVRREKVTVRGRYGSDYPVLTPASFLKEVLSQLPEHTDPNNVPLSEEQENRLAWMGVELQALNRELARANNVSDLTNDGRFGALVSYVYPDSPAKQAGIEPGFILLRLQVEGQPKPLDVRLEGSRYGYGSFPWDRLDEVPAEYFDRMPRPWPSAENSFTRALTDLGFGKKYSAEFFHDGKSLSKEFVIVQSPPHYDAAPRYKSKELGLTVRDMTYEVRRHLQKKKADPGVVISKIEPGSKAAVSGIKPYETITHVNDAPVRTVKDFETLIKDKGELRFSILRMTRERQVRIRMTAPKEKETTEKVQ